MIITVDLIQWIHMNPAHCVVWLMVVSISYLSKFWVGLMLIQSTHPC